MGKSSAEALSNVSKAMVKRENELKDFISKPFSLKDEKQAEALKNYMDDFEFVFNKKYIHDLSSPTQDICMSWYVLSYAIPFSMLINFPMGLVLGISGISNFLSRGHSTEDFARTLDDMKVLYNWMLKQNNSKYSSNIDNTELLNNKETVQRLIKMLAPFCEVEFMRAWPEFVVQTEENQEQPTYMQSFFAFAKSYVASPDVNIEEINHLKRAVETRAYDIPSVQAFQNACSYFKNHERTQSIVNNAYSYYSRAKDLTMHLVEMISPPNNQEKKMQ